MLTKRLAAFVATRYGASVWPVASVAPPLVWPRHLPGAAYPQQQQQQQPRRLMATADKAKKSSGPPPPKLPPSEWTVTLTDGAAKQLNLIRERDKRPNAKLRVYVKGGGCSGFSYKIELTDELEPEDRVFEKDGAHVIVDEDSLAHVYGATIHFKRELMSSTFVVLTNPHAESSCGCGTSFGLKK